MVTRTIGVWLLFAIVLSSCVSSRNDDESASAMLRASDPLDNAHCSGIVDRPLTCPGCHRSDSSRAG